MSPERLRRLCVAQARDGRIGRRGASLLAGAPPPRSYRPSTRRTVARVSQPCASSGSQFPAPGRAPRERCLEGVAALQRMVASNTRTSSGYPPADSSHGVSNGLCVAQGIADRRWPVLGRYRIARPVTPVETVRGQRRAKECVSAAVAPAGTYCQHLGITPREHRASRRRRAPPALPHGAPTDKRQAHQQRGKRGYMASTVTGELVSLVSLKVIRPPLTAKGASRSPSSFGPARAPVPGSRASGGV